MDEYFPLLSGLHHADVESFRNQYNKKRKRKRTAYALWLVGGMFGLHRFYLKNYFAGSVMLFLTVFTFGLLGVIGILDGINVSNLVKHYNQRLSVNLGTNIRKKYLKGAY